MCGPTRPGVPWLSSRRSPGEGGSPRRSAGASRVLVVYCDLTPSSPRQRDSGPAVGMVTQVDIGWRLTCRVTAPPPGDCPLPICRIGGSGGCAGSALLRVTAFDVEVAPLAARTACTSLIRPWAQGCVATRRAVTAGATSDAHVSARAPFPRTGGQIPSDGRISRLLRGRPQDSWQLRVKPVAVRANFFLAEALRLTPLTVVCLMMRLTEPAEIIDLVVASVMVEMGDLPQLLRTVAVQVHTERTSPATAGEDLCLDCLGDLWTLRHTNHPLM